MSTVNPPLPIAFCITDLDVGGAERALVALVTRLDRQEWSPHVYCLSARGKLADEFEQAGIPVTCFDVRSSRQIGVVFRLARALRRQRPIILQTFLFHANIVGRFAARLAGVKFVIAGIRVAEKRSRVPLWIDRQTNWLVTHNICVSRATAEFSIQQGGLNPRKVSVIANGVDVEKFQQAKPADLKQFGIPEEAQTAIVVGRLDYQKGSDLILTALAPLFAQYPHFHLLFVGSGSLESELRVHVSNSDFEGKVHFAGHRQDVAELLRAADVLILASRWEGMPNVVLEAMAAGCPVVATQVEGIDELIENGQTGTVIPPEDSLALTGAVKSFLGDPSQALARAHNAQSIVAEEFTFDRVVSDYAGLYRDLAVR